VIRVPGFDVEHFQKEEFMAELCEEGFDELKIDKRDFVPTTLDDEVRVDKLCSDLLQRFYRESMMAGLSPELATVLASSADYFIRDFVVSIKNRSIFEERPGLVRQFAGNWYIVNTLEPDAAEIERYLDGIKEFYRFLHGHQLISLKFLQSIEAECAQLDYYAGRIESFWEIKGDGYQAWEKECTLKDQPVGSAGKA
jgi:CRISPR/Cas system-associated exonuclease Cas4 (RecB family)